MAVLNEHTRCLPATPDEAGALIDALASDDDLLWPQQPWPTMRFDRPLGVGASGGHGPVRYYVESYVPARWIRFRFTAPRGFDGFHEFTLRAGRGEDTVLCHTLVIRPRGRAWITWPALWRPGHDLVLEECLDRAERAVTGTVRTNPSRYIRVLRALVSRVRRAR